MAAQGKLTLKPIEEELQTTVGGKNFVWNTTPKLLTLMDSLRVNDAG